MLPPWLSSNGKATVVSVVIAIYDAQPCVRRDGTSHTRDMCMPDHSASCPTCSRREWGVGGGGGWLKIEREADM